MPKGAAGPFQLSGPAAPPVYYGLGGSEQRLLLQLGPSAAVSLVSKSCLTCLGLCVQSGRVQKHHPPVRGERGDGLPGGPGAGHDGTHPLWPLGWHPLTGEASLDPGSSPPPHRCRFWPGTHRWRLCCRASPAQEAGSGATARTRTTGRSPTRGTWRFSSTS